MKREKQKHEEQQKQQQQQQGKTRSQDPELDGPKEEELVPEKLERVSECVSVRVNCFLFCAGLLWVLESPGIIFPDFQGLESP